MLENWFNPLPKDFENQDVQTLGGQVFLHGTSFPVLKKTRIAIVGIDASSANATREKLYAYAPFDVLSLADLGNVKKKNVDFLIPIFHELLRSKIIPIVIGKNPDTSLALFLAYREAKSLVNVVLVDSIIKEKDDYIKKMLFPKNPLLFHFGAIGLHGHEASYKNVETLQKYDYDLIRLGKSLDAIDNCEPVMRDADFTSIHLRALKASEAPAVVGQTPSGYVLEDACHLARYAGFSDKLNAFGLFGFDTKLKGADMTAQVSAQIIWYFLDGLANRKNDFPVSTDGMLEYLVEFREYDFPITFWKSNRSGRWWVQVVQKTKANIKRHQLVPCSYSDYQAACSGDLADRIVNAMNRFV